MPLKPRFFKSAAEFRAWLEEHHARETEIQVGLWKVKSGRTGITYKQAVDEAICYGWIDGKLTPIDERCYSQRFTPRRKTSNWSAVNVARVAVLRAEGRMTAAGEAAFAARRPEKTGVYSFERKDEALMAPSFEKAFRAKTRAWAFWQAQPPWYRRAATHWVMTAKKDETRERRLAALMKACAAGRRLS